MQVSDLMKLPYPDDFFDGAIDVVAVCYCGFEEAQRAYHALARVAKPGARLFSRTFARGCWGEGTGEPAGRHMWLCSEGPLQGLGATRFTAEDEVAELLRGWTVTGVERASLTMDGGRHDIRHLLIEGIKQ